MIALAFKTLCASALLTVVAAGAGVLVAWLLRASDRWD